MNGRQLLVIIVVLMFLLVPASFAGDGDYTIPSVVKNVTVNDDGCAVITEEVLYDIEGSVNGTYRTIPLEANQSVTNISVETPGYYNSLEIDNKDGKTSIRVWLYEDEAKTRKTTDARARVIYRYTIIRGVKVYNDIAEVQYMTWGSEWNSKVDSLECNIKIPGSSDEVEYWNNPEDNVVSSQWTGNDTLTTKLENIKSRESFEQRILMPKSYIKDTTYAQVIDMDAKKLIEQDQKNYQKDDMEADSTVSKAFWIILGLLALIPVGIYGLYGRDQKTSYKSKYEYDIPTSESPVQVYALTRGNLNSVGQDALFATILDLIDRKYFKIIVNDGENTVIQRTDKDTSPLKEHEKSMIEFLSSYEVNGNIYLDNISDRQNRDYFIQFRNRWLEQARKEEIPDSYVEKYFDNRCRQMFRKFIKIFLFMAVVIFIIAFSGVIDSSFINGLLGAVAFFLLLLCAVMFIIPKSVSGRRTAEGKETYMKWKNFERYIKDYSLIREKPPSSVEVWGKYLVYAVALGCADKATENMRKYFDTNDIRYDSFSNATSFVYNGSFAYMKTSLNTLSRPDYSGSGIGRSGSGGFGGGGGGTF